MGGVHMPADHRAALLEARYANHFQVGQNEYEFVLDFSQFHSELAEADPAAPQVRIVRIVMAPPFAKALLQTLGRAVDEHERDHGSIAQG
jgi:hypothetical protein